MDGNRRILLSEYESKQFDKWINGKEKEVIKQIYDLSNLHQKIIWFFVGASMMFIGIIIYKLVVP